MAAKGTNTALVAGVAAVVGGAAVWRYKKEMMAAFESIRAHLPSITKEVKEKCAEEAPEETSVTKPPKPAK